MTEPLDPPVTPAESARATLIEFPCAFPIKVMGHKVDDFVSTLTTIALEFDPQFDAASIELRQSKAGNYLGVTPQCLGHFTDSTGRTVYGLVVPPFGQSRSLKTL